jgi:glutamate formiminotransferase
MDVVFDAVEREAGKYGVTVVESQIIGLVPRAALNGTTAEYLRLAHFSEQQILETHLRK